MPTSGTEERKLAAIMFTDIVGYTALSQRHETLALELLEEHRQLLRPIFPKHQGTEIKTLGDGFLVQFNSALAAARCAIEIQKILFGRNASEPEERKIKIRIGIHVGDVVQREGDVLGDGVNIASRLQPLAAPGGICISVDVARQIRHNLEASVVTVGQAELKNVEMPLEVCRIVLPWEKQSEAGSPGTARPASSEAGRGVPPSRTNMLKWGGIVALVLLAVGLRWFLMRQGRGSTTSTNAAPVVARSAVPGRIRSLAVKPLDDFSGDTNNAYLSDGMTEALCAALGNVSALRVPGRSSVMRYKGGLKSIQEMAKELNVDAIVEGSVQRMSMNMLITVQLVEAATDRHLWATNYERNLSEFFKVQSEVAQAIAEEVKVRLTSEDHVRLGTARSAKPEAVTAYLQGRYRWHRRTREDVLKAVELLERAVAIDPDYALAHAALADAYLVVPARTGGQVKEWYQKARASALRALELDSRLGEPHATLGVISSILDWNWQEAEREFQLAVALNPAYATARQWYSEYLWTQRINDSLAQGRIAVNLDPASAIIKVSFCRTLRLARSYDEAIAEGKTAVSLAPDLGFAHLSLGEAYLAKGFYEQAQIELKKAAELDNQDVRPWQARIFARSARIDEARKLARVLEKEGPLAPWMFWVHAELGEADKAFASLNERLEKGSFVVGALKFDPALDNLRADPRWLELLKKVGLDK